MDEDFVYSVRTQFSFFAGDRALARILDEIAEQGINITGYFQTKKLQLGSDESQSKPLPSNLVRLVPGRLERETKMDLRGTKEALEDQCVEYQEKHVIQVTGITPEPTGVISAIFDALRRKVTVYAIYPGEETSLILDVSDIKKALEILRCEE